MHTIDADSELGAINLSAAQSLAASGNGTAVDISGYVGILKVNLNSAAVGGGVNTLDVHIETGDAADGSDAQDITDAVFTQVTDGGASFQSIGVDTRLCGKYIREVHALGAGASVICSIQAFGQQKYQ